MLFSHPIVKKSYMEWPLSPKFFVRFGIPLATKHSELPTYEMKTLMDCTRMLLFQPF